MKRIITFVAIAAASLVMASKAHAQFGVIAGLTTSKVSAEIKDIKNSTLFHAGVTYKFDLGAGFALQPSIIYQVKGAKLGELDKATGGDFQLKSGFVEVPLGIQWGPDLMAFRPFVMAEPFIGYRISSNNKGSDSFSGWVKDAQSKLEYGFGVGGGIELASHIQVSVQWFKNLGNMFANGATPNSTWSNVTSVKNFQGLKFSLAILF